jgi:HK97 family phage prohead protease
METVKKPKPGQVEERQAPALEVDGKKIRGKIPYGVESRDMGGWKEVIERGALNRTELDDLVVTVDHVGLPLGRYPRTLEVEDRDDGLHWSVDPPESRADVREAVERGDLKAGSWRMVVGKDEWRGDTRHVLEIAQLRDVSVVTRPAYPTADVEFRSAEATQKEQTEVEAAEQKTEDRAEEHRVESYPAGSLRVEERTDIRMRSLAEEYRSRGFPGEIATLGWDEFRTASFAGTVDVMSQPRRDGVALGYDQRWAYPAFETIAVGADVTSVAVLQQTSRTIPAGTAVLRNIDAVTTKPEVTTVTNLTTIPLKQVAAIETNIPNVVLEQDAIETVVEVDLRLAIDGGLDQLVKAAVDASGFQAPGSDPLPTSIRKAITTIQGNGYAPDTLLLTPSASETLDTLVTGVSGGTADYVYGAGQFANAPFGLRVRVSKVLAAPAVVDSRAFGKLYVSPISLARFEVDAGATNRSNVRLEGHAAFGTERQNAAVRIAAS